MSRPASRWPKRFTRLFDNLSLEIRNGRLTRDEAVQIVRDYGDQTPYEDIAKFCNFAGITEAHFWEIIEKFRNLDVWVRVNGCWQIKDFIIPDWNWT